MAGSIPVPDLIYKIPISGTIIGPDQLRVAFTPVDNFLGRLAWVRRYLALFFVSFGVFILSALFLWWLFTYEKVDISEGWISSLLMIAFFLLLTGVFCFALPQILISIGCEPKCFKTVEMKPYRDLLEKFRKAEIALAEHDKARIDNIVLSTDWALILFSRYETHRSFRLPNAERIYSKPLLALIDFPKSESQDKNPLKKIPCELIPKTVAGDTIWSLYSIWNLSADEVEQIFDTADFYPDSDVKKLRAKVSALAIVERVSLIRKLEEKIAAGEEGLEKQLANLRSRAPMIHYIRSARKMFENKLSNNGLLEEHEVQAFARLNQKESKGRDSKLEQLVCGSYSSVNPAIEEQAFKLGLISTRYIENKPAN